MGDSPVQKFKAQCLERIEDLYDLGYWLIPLAPFNAKQGKSFEAPWGGKFDVKRDNEAGKRPLYTNWQSKRLTKKQLIEIFSKEPLYNLGVACGPERGLITLDIDFKNGGREFLEKYTEQLEAGLWEFTGGGLHVHYLPPTWIDKVPSIGSGKFFKDGQFWPGVELKSTGTQVVTNPSYHPTNWVKKGKRHQYHFEHGCGLESREAEMEELTEAFYREVLSKRRSEGKDTFRDPKKPIKTKGFKNDEADIDQCIKDIAAVKGVSGNLNNTIYEVACKVRDKDISPKIAFKIVTSWCSTNCPEPVEPEVIQIIVGNSYRYATGDVGSTSGAAMLEEAYANAEVEVPDDIVKGLEEETGGLPYKKPSVAAIRYLKLYPLQYLLDNDWFVYEKDNWIRKDKDRYFDELLLDLVNLTDADANVKTSHCREVFAQLRGLTFRKALTDQPVLKSWIRAKNHNEIVRVENGLVNLKNGEKLKHSPDWFSTTKLPFAYDPDAKCPEFLGFLDSLWDHEGDAPEEDGPIRNQADQLQRFMGYLLSSSMKEHKYGLFIGVSRAGKGVLERVIEQLIGEENCHSTTLDDLGEKHGTMSLPGKQLCLISDAEDISSNESKRALQRIKSMTGGDTIPVNPKYGKPYDFQNTAKIVMTVNEFPKFIDPAGALGNRTILFNFTKSFAGMEDKSLDGKLKAELAGIFNWALEGYRLWQEDGVVGNSLQVQPLMEDMRHAMNPIAAFIDEAIEIWEPPEMAEDVLKTHKIMGTEPKPESDHSETKQDLFAAFGAFQHEDNKKNWLSSRKFFINLKRELSSKGWLETWGEFRPWSGGGAQSRRILGVRIKTEFRSSGVSDDFGNIH